MQTCQRLEQYSRVAGPSEDSSGEGPEVQSDITRQARSVKSEEGQVQRSSRPESNDNCGPPCCQDTKELPWKEPTEPENLEVRSLFAKPKRPT
ncbi:hypothetical protein Tco_1496144, partial [Tanacetum coccineum]